MNAITPRHVIAHDLFREQWCGRAPYRMRNPLMKCSISASVWRCCGSRTAGNRMKPRSRCRLKSDPRRATARRVDRCTEEHWSRKVGGQPHSSVSGSAADPAGRPPTLPKPVSTSTADRAQNRRQCPLKMNSGGEDRAGRRDRAISSPLTSSNQTRWSGAKHAGQIASMPPALVRSRHDLDPRVARLPTPP